MARLTLDPQAGCFMYQTDEGTYVKVAGVAQALVAIPRDHAELNHFPFLPYKPEEGPQAKTYRISCKLCLLQKNDGLCYQSLTERSF